MGDETLYAQFANEAYNYILQPGAPVPFASDYTVIATFHGNWSGYDAFAAFNPTECRVVVANTGTDPWSISDWLEDAVLAPLGHERRDRTAT